MHRLQRARIMPQAAHQRLHPHLHRFDQRVEAAFREIVQIRLPSAIPYIFSALKVSVTLAVIGAVVAEFVASETGLGYAILFSTSSFNVPAAFANLAVLVVLSLMLFKLVSIVQVIFFSWSLEKTKEK